jgi:hypothetical protein
VSILGWEILVFRLMLGLCFLCVLGMELVLVGWLGICCWGLGCSWFFIVYIVDWGRFGSMVDWGREEVGSGIVF